MAPQPGGRVTSSLLVFDDASYSEVDSDDLE